jgi:hypothetical protein
MGAVDGGGAAEGLLPRGAAVIVEESKGWSESVKVSPGSSFSGVSEGDRGRGTGIGTGADPGAMAGSVVDIGSADGRAAVSEGSPVGISIGKPSIGGSSIGTSSPETSPTGSSSAGETDANASGGSGASGSTVRASGTGSVASGAARCGSPARKEAAWPVDRCRCAARIRADMKVAALVPAMIGVSAGVGRNLGPMAEIAAKRTATMKSPPPKSTRIVSSTRTPPNMTRIPTRKATIMANERVTTKARIGLSRTLYRNSNLQLPVIIHNTAHHALATPLRGQGRDFCARPGQAGI